VILLVAFGHSLLAMSGFETLAQVYRELAHPKLKNLRLTANIICTYAVVCTGITAILAVMIIPDAVRPSFYDNMIGGLVMNLAGPELLKLAFHVFVVIVGVMILSGAVNTSLIGVNGVLNRVAEDGVLVDWFRKPHRRFGTTYRILNTMALLQIVTIVASRGNLPDMTRLESGVELRRDYYPLEEIVGAVLHRMDHRLARRQVITSLPPSLPLVFADRPDSGRRDCRGCG
jgi:amino acid transporter